jgi:chemotaxis receptor (MCP) glutamine deamidase CheD
MPKQSTTHPTTQPAGKTAYIPVGPNEYRAISPGDRLVARYVGSDIALLIQASKTGFAALLRFSVSDSRQNSEMARENPFSCADTAICLLLQSTRSLRIDNSDISVCAVGGAASAAGDDSPQAGAQNQFAIREILKREGIRLQGEDLGGSQNRSLWFDGVSGRLIVRTAEPVPCNARWNEKETKELPMHLAAGR